MRAWRWQPVSPYRAGATLVLLGIGAMLLLAALSTRSDTGERSQPVPVVGHDVDPTWSPDGSRIAFTRRYYFRYGHFPREIWVVGLDGTREQRVTPAGATDKEWTDASDPLWSPDGRQIAYQLYTYTATSPDEVRTNEAGGLRVVAADGTGERALTTNIWDYPTSWSRDGRRILFVRSRDLYTVDVRTRRVTRVTRSRRIYKAASAQLSADGRWLAADTRMSVEVPNGDEYRMLDVLRLAGRRWGPVGRDDSGDDSRLTFAWAPRGARLAFASDFRLFVTTPNGKPRRVPSSRKVDAVAWSPNGSQLLWTKLGKSTMYVADADDGRRRRAIVTPQTLAALAGDRASRPDDLELVDIRPSWAGRQVAFPLRFPCNRSGIHVVDVRSRAIRRLTNRC
jgi:Tol biopolymer transport system component